MGYILERMNVQKRLVVILLMFIALLTLVLASLPISSEVFPWFQLFTDEMLPTQIHILAGNWLFVLIAIHLVCSGTGYSRSYRHSATELQQQPVLH